MIFLKYLRRVLKKERVHRSLEYVSAALAEPRHETAPAAPELPPSIPPCGGDRENEIAFSPQSDLEAYVRGLEVSQQAIERWISAGVLLPEETRVAAKMIRIMCLNNRSKPSSEKN